MFHPRSSAFARNISVIENRLRALENELERTGRTAGRRASAGMSAAGDQIGDAIASAVSEIVDRFRSGRRLAGDEVVSVGNQAVKIGAKIGNDAVHRIASEVEHRPLVTLGVAIGVGILIGIMLDAGVSAASRPTGRREKAVHANTRS
jgi:ElaB/YqjD/DUF883 family membrane-anchored ribosome-binding protein